MASPKAAASLDTWTSSDLPSPVFASRPVTRLTPQQELKGDKANEWPMWGWAALRKDSTRFPNFTQAETGAIWVEMGIKGTDVGGSNKVVLANSATWAS